MLESPHGIHRWSIQYLQGTTTPTLFFSSFLLLAVVVPPSARFIIILQTGILDNLASVASSIKRPRFPSGQRKERGQTRLRFYSLRCVEPAPLPFSWIGTKRATLNYLPPVSYVPVNDQAHKIQSETAEMTLYDYPTTTCATTMIFREASMLQDVRALTNPKTLLVPCTASSTYNHAAGTTGLDQSEDRSLYLVWYGLLATKRHFSRHT